MAWSAAQLAPEVREEFTTLCRNMFNSPDWNEERVRDLSEHLTMGELLATARFSSGEGRTIVAKLGRLIGDTVPRAVNQVKAELRKRGYDT